LNKINFVSLGCAKNLVDSEKMIGTLTQAGCGLETSPAHADAVIVNTCGFIGPALEETEAEIRRLLKLPSRPRIYVFGCAVNRAAAVLKKRFPRVDGWFRIEEKEKLFRTVGRGADRQKARLVTTAGYAYLKIAEGCSNHCAYCTIPSIRGELRSAAMKDLYRETEELAGLGINEIVLVAQDTTAYGTDFYRRPMLPSLLRKLSGIKSVSWLRVLYCHPGSITGELIAEIADNPKVCKYVDLPIQHSSSRILELMNRRAGPGRISRIMREIKRRGISLRTTVIAGFPTESDAEHEALKRFIKDHDIDWLGVFPYCREPGTAAAGLDPLPPRTVLDRYENLLKLQRSILMNKNRARVGRSYQVLINGRNGYYTGHAEFAAPEIDSRIIIPGGELTVGEFYRARITGCRGNDLVAEIAEPTRKRRNA
jgi:ribosomal protein S12 methylthiotransferase